MGHGYELHRSDLSALAVVMDAAGRGEPVTPRALARAVRISPSATTALLERLETAGHVVRRPHPRDRRSVVVEITDRAISTGAQIFGPVGAATAAVMDEFTEDELQIVVRFLDRVVAATEQLSTSPPEPQ